MSTNESHTAHPESAALSAAHSLRIADRAREDAQAESTACEASDYSGNPCRLPAGHAGVHSRTRPESAARQETGESLPCPFCGSQNVSDGEYLIESEAHGVGRVACKQSECLDCGARGPLSQPVTGPDYGCVAAIAAWNRRAALHLPTQEAVASVCIATVNDAYGHGSFLTLEVQVKPGTKFKAGDKLYAAPITP